MTRTKIIVVTKQDVIDRAKALFVEKKPNSPPIKNTTKSLRDILGPVCSYFRSETELLYAVIDDVIAEEAPNKEKLLESLQETTIENLQLFFFKNSTYFNKYHLLFEAISKDEVLKNYTMQKMITASEPFVVTFIKRGNDNGSWNCATPENTARFILYGIYGIEDNANHLIPNLISKLLETIN